MKYIDAPAASTDRSFTMSIWKHVCMCAGVCESAWACVFVCTCFFLDVHVHMCVASSEVPSSHGEDVVFGRWSWRLSLAVNGMGRGAGGGVFYWVFTGGR
jgi:hypothetical protein